MSSKTKTTGTLVDSTPALVPKLRFPEFLGGDAWESTTIGALGHFYYGKSAPKWSLTEDAPTPCVRYGELYTKFGPAISETYSRTNTPPETLRFSKGGEILIPRVGEKPEDFGKCCSYLPLKGIAIGEMISVLETKQHPLFYTYYFRNMYQEFAKVVEGQNVKNLYFTELQPLPIHRPTLPEQKKIAECLSSVDDLIAAQGRKVDALKTHKKGLMQQLLPRKGKTQPSLRFPEFQSAGEWKEASLADLCDKIMDGTHFSPKTKGGPRPYLTSKNIKNGWIDLSNLSYISEEEHLAIYKKCPVKLHDVLLTKDGANTGNCAVNNLNYDFSLLSSVAVLRGKPQALLQGFLFQSILSDSIQSLISESMSGQAITRITLAKISAFSIPITSLPEQQRIADCLTALDCLIATHIQKLETLKAHKQGLMQRLFPATAKVKA